MRALAEPPRTVRAAGGVLWRTGAGGELETALVHRPKYDDWSLPKGKLDAGEHPLVAAVREVGEETGLEATVGALLGVHDEHFTGTAPHGREEDFHGVHLVFAATVADGEPTVRETEGTTDAVAWFPVADVDSGILPVSEVVTAGLGMGTGR